MGGCVSVSISYDRAVSHVSNCLCGDGNYIHKLEKNLEVLRVSAEELKERRDDLLRRVTIEEDKGLRRLAEVQEWLSRVEAIELQVDNLLNASIDETQRLCLCGYSSTNCISSHQYGKKIFKKGIEVENLKSRVFETVADRVLAPKVDKRPIRQTVGMGTMFKEAWNRLMDDGVGTLGLYGMGGVGKTTLLTQINNNFLEAWNEFDTVIWVVVSKDLQIEKIQEEIGKKLDLFNKEWGQKRQDEKAIDISNVLCKKKFVLLLDDIWEKVDVTEIGVPYPSSENGCKVAFTTRSREVCGRMGVDAEMEVKCLSQDDAWDLFRQKVRENILNTHPDILKLAKIVAKKCRGLPLALNVIGETMSYKTTVQEWHRAIDVLTSTITEFEGMEDKILPILKFSYDNLNGEKEKLCFQYCALFPEDYLMHKDRLVEYWICEGIIDGDQDRDKAENLGYELIGKLVRACLLMEDEFEGYVRLHDVVREMALWIASDFGRQKENFVVQAGAHFHQIPKVENWNIVSRMSLISNQIENISGCPKCPKLLTLLLKRNNLVKISGEFFQFMVKLVVLDLSRNLNLTELPEEISELISLQYLNLSVTGIRQLPEGLKDLRKLIYLNLERTSELRSIVGISSLSNLRILRLLDSGVPSDLSLVQELHSLKQLDVLTITLKDASTLKQFLCIRKLTTCIQHLLLEEFSSEIDGISLVATLDSLRYFGIESCDISEIKIDWESKQSEIVSPLQNRVSPSYPRFQNLFHVTIYNCKGLRDLTWLLFAPNLTFLHVAKSMQIEEIINKEKAVGVTNEQSNIFPFRKLDFLSLRSLHELKSIYWSPLPFPFLRKVVVSFCPKLMKLPLNSESAKGQNLVIDAEEEWIKELEWEDEATKNRFCPSF